MQFRLRTLMWVFVILWSALAAFGDAGILAAVGVVLIAWVIHRKRSRFVESLTVITIVGVPAALLAIHTKTCVYSSEAICRQSISRHALALRAYYSEHGSFPPAYIADRSGKPIHSWRVLVLPYLGLNDVYRKYDFRKPWNDPKNVPVPNGGFRMCCPDDPSWYRPNATGDFTSYFAVVGPKTAWRGRTPTKRSDLPDNGRCMILLVESAGHPINWKEPKDLTYEEAMSGVNRQGTFCVSSTHTEGGDYFHHACRGAYAAFADGSVHFLPEDISPDDLRALLTGDTGRFIDVDALACPSLDWAHIVGLTVFIASSAVLLVGAVTQRLRQPPKPESNEH
jgi:hypothetical protein